MSSIRRQLLSGVPPDKVVYPDGRIPGNARSFADVVDEIRHATYAVLRLRPTATGDFDVFALGSGFFFSKRGFLTCNHVLNDARNPHRDGDGYRLVNSLASTEAGLMSGRSFDIMNVKRGTDIHFFPESDCAVLIQNTGQAQRFVAFDYGEVDAGREIGVAGYPLPTFQVVLVNGQRALTYNGLIYRVAKGIVTATYLTNLDTPATGLLKDLAVIEVNFLFVPGNSGGPIFDAQTGRVLGFVQSFRTNTVQRTHVKGPFNDLGAEAPDSYVETAHAIYSLGIRMGRVRKAIEQFGGGL